MTGATTAASTGGRSGRPPADPDSRFAREGGRIRFTARVATVTGIAQPAPGFVRVTFSGPDFTDFVSVGPSDHVRLFLPDPATGELVAPRAVGPDEDGLIRPDAPAISRDFTPLRSRTSPDTGQVEVDVDFYLHADAGPASAWAAAARPGDGIVIVGPRGSRRAPQRIDGLVLIVDETSLPSAHRWVREVPSGTSIDVIATIDGDAGWVEDYLLGDSGRSARIRTLTPDASGTAVAEALDALGPIGEGTYVFAAGEASALIPVRRALRAAGLARDQFAVSGYWRRGEAGFDHHAPIDPTDPD